MKRIFGAKSKLLISILTLVFIMVVGGTMAYLFATSDIVENIFSSAQLQTEIDEPDNGAAADKVVTIQNTGESPAWVRARLLVSGIDPANVKVVATMDAANSAAEQDGNSKYIYLVMPVNAWKVYNGSWVVPSDSDNVTYSNFADKWIYYTESLDGKNGNIVDSTDELLYGVVFGSEVNAADISITVTHESVLALDTSSVGGKPAYVAAFENPAGASTPSPAPTT